MNPVGAARLVAAAFDLGARTSTRPSGLTPQGTRPYNAARGDVHAIVGREAEPEAVEQFLDGVPSGPSLCWSRARQALARRRSGWRRSGLPEDRAYRVLQIRPAQSEAELSYVAPTDLLGEAFDLTRASLPAPQERALAIALLRAEPNEPADPRTTASGLAGVLTAPTRRSSCDSTTSSGSMRPRLGRSSSPRAGPPRVGLLVTRRARGLDEAPSASTGAAGRSSTAPRTGAALAAALHHVIAHQLGNGALAADAGSHHGRLRGNPLRARDCARAGTRLERPSAWRPLPVPRASRSSCSPASSALAEALRPCWSPRRPPARRSRWSQRRLCSNATPGQRSCGQEAGRRPEGERIHFTHPLLASVVYGAASNSQRRRLHTRLADVVTDPEGASPHLAARSPRPTRGRRPSSNKRRTERPCEAAHDAAASYSRPPIG